ncbi:MAG: tRNA (adenosine(37)-N6)-threonylcarbamoyltransferase complex dimerization subunit type 1 TsaB [Chloroflexi bacterium]|nr:tRNA (adenosine(37)-N6)-threonylcarbamoyltransferase complex dimerization subunit type 1 TsaB [Chloroflexota bacterium]
MLVAIDTSGTMSGLALMRDGELLAEIAWQSDRRHSEQLLPQLDALCRLVGVAPADLTHVAVSIGPGSWSGIRVGISVAKGLALANSAHVIGINALDVLAWPMRHRAPITACISLGRGRFATSAYPHPAWPIGTMTPTNCHISEMHIPADHLLVYEPHMRTLLPDTVVNHLHHHVAFPQPRTLAEIATHRLRTSPYQPDTVIEPLYLGEPVQPKP